MERVCESKSNFVDKDRAVGRRLTNVAPAQKCNNLSAVDIKTTFKEMRSLHLQYKTLYINGLLDCTNIAILQHCDTFNPTGLSHVTIGKQ